MNEWETCYRLTQEIILEGKRVDPNDSKEMAAKRARMAADIDFAEQRGLIVDIPSEIEVAKPGEKFDDV